MIERMEVLQRTGRLARVDLLTDFQLQIEHVLDMQGRALVVFADAAATGPAPFSYGPVHPRADAGLSTHAMDPGAVLHVFEQVTPGSAPETYLLAIRGYSFDLGSGLTPEADANLARAVDYLVDLLGP